jgi:hypothetical protein
MLRFLVTGDRVHYWLMFRWDVSPNENRIIQFTAIRS